LPLPGRGPAVVVLLVELDVVEDEVVELVVLDVLDG
jgi:hypothetical protein